MFSLTVFVELAAVAEVAAVSVTTGLLARDPSTTGLLPLSDSSLPPELLVSDVALLASTLAVAMVAASTGKHYKTGRQHKMKETKDAVVLQGEHF